MTYDNDYHLAYFHFEKRAAVDVCGKCISKNTIHS